MMIKRITNFLNEVKIELKKVSWSNKEELIGSTIVVLISIFLLALFIGICDFALSRFMSMVVR